MSSIALSGRPRKNFRATARQEISAEILEKLVFARFFQHAPRTWPNSRKNVRGGTPVHTLSKAVLNPFVNHRFSPKPEAPRRRVSQIPQGASLAFPVPFTGAHFQTTLGCWSRLQCKDAAACWVSLDVSLFGVTIRHTLVRYGCTLHERVINRAICTMVL